MWSGLHATCQQPLSTQELLEENELIGLSQTIVGCVRTGVNGQCRREEREDETGNGSHRFATSAVNLHLLVYS